MSFALHGCRGSALALVLACAVPACLVSFEDYPLERKDEGLGGVGGAGSAGSAGSASLGGAAALGGASAAAGGSSASGGSAPAGELIDDFEDADASILPLSGRGGDWYAANDFTGAQTPSSGAALLPELLVPARSGSARGGHTAGGPFRAWGALIGTSLAVSGSTPVAYDASRFRGIRLWVRSAATGATAATKVRLALPTPETQMGGGCTMCNDHFGVDLPLSASFRQVDVPFSQLRQQGWGLPQLSAPSLDQVMGIQLMFAVNVSFDLWVDDIAFY